MNDWISVQDRLPDENDDVYLLFTNGVVTFFGRYFDGNSYKEELLWKPENGWVDKNGEITHWMPLPQPPKQ